ncbi:hypothetical protein F2Q68_00029684 [Brassica cretica]|uniref:THH1/TOM1/TOM3 domain-containing protein n=1 Tax=Brassica cretica TaxID=69181 RepID=A0A8S9GFS0_BRACR|nr:hypothetical protein F2Q68_00029684 [Brassica cretica]
MRRLSVFVAANEQSRSLPTDKLRKTYIAANVAVYLSQVVIWVCIWVNDNSTVELVGKIFMAVVSFIAALGYLHHGGRYVFFVFCLSRSQSVWEVMQVFCWILLDFPGLLFFSAYTLLLLFWAQIYHEASKLSIKIFL